MQEHSFVSHMTEEDEAGRLLESRNLGPVWATESLRGKKWMKAQDWAIGSPTLDILKKWFW